MRPWKTFCILACWLVVWRAGPPAGAAVPVDYARQIKPLLHEKCNACHGALKQKAGLRTDAVQLLRSGGDNGPLVVAGKPDESLLIHAVEGTHDVEKMPREGTPLSGEQLTLLRTWIEQGAVAADEPIPARPGDHWSFRPPLRPTVPAVKNAVVRNPIDAFVAADRDRLGLSPLDQAPRQVLLRRVYLDLVGVPPTPAEMQAFLADGSPDAYERTVDRLLADERHGQRWGRHWMDVWRYSDWAGYKAEIRDSRRGIWRWRDWIVESLNADRPYDEMVRLMIAADELVGQPALGARPSPAAPASPLATAGEHARAPDYNADDLRAGGYLARSWFRYNRNVWMDNTVEHFGKAFLGLTLNCARCHDHKYDPISQEEYYQFRAFFEPIDVRSDPVAGLPNPEEDGIAMVFDKDPTAPTYLLRRGDEKQPVKDRPIAPLTPEVFGPPAEIKPVEVPAATWYPGLREQVRKDLLAKAEAALELARVARRDAKTAKATKLADARLAAADASLSSVEARLAADAETHAGAGPSESRTADTAHPKAKEAEQADRIAAVARAEADFIAARDAHADAEPHANSIDVKLKKAFEEKKKALAAAEKALADAKTASEKPLTGNYAPLTATYPATSTGRRSALAGWVTSPKNPLTARVAINHIWMRHFGEPLVPTEFDFGLNGKAPTNRPLLDWLAVELMERNWSMKHIHRLIVTSATYKLASGSPDDAVRYAANQKIDPDNVKLWRANVRRMEAEVVRDSLLAVAGKLNTAAGGPELDQNAWQSSVRRSLYYRHAYEKQGVFAMVFDAPSPTECYRRVETVTPQQSLALANSPLAVSHARLLAGELAKQASTDGGEGAFIRAAFERVLNRPPTSDEMETCTSFIQSQSRMLQDAGSLTPHDGIEKATVPPAADAGQRARENLVHVLINHNDFVTIR